MGNKRLLIASCIAAAALALPLAGPVHAQDRPADCVGFWGDYLTFPPTEWSLWDLADTSDPGKITLRGDLALAYAGTLTAYWSGVAADLVTCLQASAQGTEQCLATAAAPLLASSPDASRYVSIGLDGVVVVDYGAALEDVTAIAICGRDVVFVT